MTGKWSDSRATPWPHGQKIRTTTPIAEGAADPESDLALVSTVSIDRLVLGEITGWDLPHPLLAVWLLGLFEGQAEVEQLRAEVRRLDSLDASRPARDVRALLQPTFAELSRIRGEHERAEQAARRRGAA